jgi:peptidoglycan/LPS O-acetylase OafA/YrhL
MCFVPFKWIFEAKIAEQMRSKILNKGRIVFIGEISYTIYLFHKSFFYSFDLLSITANSVWLKLLAVAIFFPVFLIFCIQSEKLGTYCSKILKKYNPFVR